MASRKHSASLTADDLAALTAALADGKRATVYLVEGTPSLGLAAGSSARVISISGTTVLVRPRGVDDELPYEADELRRTKTAPEPVRKAAPRKASSAPAKARVVPTKAPASVTAAPAPATPAAPPAQTAEKAPAQAPDKASAKAPAKAPAKSARPRGAAKSVTVTIYGSPDNQWSVAVTRGAHKPQRSRPISPDSVDAAVRELGDAAASEAVTALTTAARAEAQRRVEELSRELDEARRALAALD